MIFAEFGRRFQLKIKNRESAGNILAQTLKTVIKKEDRKDTIVLGIPSGGLIIADVIATKLSCHLDLIISKRLRAPHNKEVAIGAIVEDGTYYLNDIIIKDLKISYEYIRNEISYQLADIGRLSDMYNLANKTFLQRNDPIIKNKILVIADDGAATGSTIIATVRTLRKTCNPKGIIVAIPVSPRSTVNLLRNEKIDQIEVITSPNDSNFGSIEQYYQNFTQVTDNQVLDIILSMRN